MTPMERQKTRRFRIRIYLEFRLPVAQIKCGHENCLSKDLDIHHKRYVLKPEDLSISLSDIIEIFCRQHHKRLHPLHVAQEDSFEN